MSWYEKLNDKDYWVQLEKERQSQLYVTKDIDKDIAITAQPIYANHEFTIIDDSDPNFVVVEDETGMVRTIPREKKNDSSAWIIAAAIAGLMIL